MSMMTLQQSAMQHEQRVEHSLRPWNSASVASKLSLLPGGRSMAVGVVADAVATHAYSRRTDETVSTISC